MWFSEERRGPLSTSEYLACSADIHGVDRHMSCYHFNECGARMMGHRMDIERRLPKESHYALRDVVYISSRQQLQS